ncbi:MAG: hypothetical protein AAFV31_15440 [Pseudomonadota bacterium]
MRILILALIFPAHALAFSPEKMRTEETFGAWTVVCDSVDDMGGITYFDCAATPAPGIYLRATPADAMLIARAGATLTGLPMTPCAAGQCSPSLDPASMETLLPDVRANCTALDPIGFVQAFAAINRILKR